MSKTSAQAKAALQAAVKATKKKKGGPWWMPGRTAMIVAGLAVAVAVGTGIWQRLPISIGSKKIAQSEQAFISGNLHFEQGDLATAVQHYRAAVALNPFHADAWTNLGNALSSAMQYSSSQRTALYDEAVKAYTKAIGANSRHIDAHFNLGVLHHTLEKVELAIPSYERAIRIDSQHHDALSNLASARHKLGDFDGAIRAYEKAINVVQGLDPTLVDAQMLSMLYYLLGSAVSSQPDKKCKGAPCAELAAQKVRQALRINPENAEARDALSTMRTDPNVTESSQEVVKVLFADFEEEYDNLQLNGQSYQVPSLLRKALEELNKEHRGEAQFEVTFDAGCGMGACGMQIRNMTKVLVGADKETKMVEKSMEKGFYDEVIEHDVTTGLAKYSDRKQKDFHKKVDLVVAGDLVVHYGDLSSFFGSIAGGMAKGGWFAFTAESLNESELVDPPPEASKDDSEEEQELKKLAVTKQDLKLGYKQRNTGRYAHTREYIAGVAAKHDFKVLVHTDVVPRSDGVNDVAGQLMVAELQK